MALASASACELQNLKWKKGGKKRIAHATGADPHLAIRFARSVGVGGLGHFGILFAAAMGAEVVAISHSPSKKEDALKMGAKEFISTKEEPNWAEKYKNNPLDLIVSTASSNAVDLPAMLSTLKVHGRMIYVGMPEDGFKDIRAQHFAGNGCFFGSSHIGSKQEAIEMLKLAADKKIKPWIEVLPMKECSKAVQRVADNNVSLFSCHGCR